MGIELIAEIGWNHMGDMKLAADMISAAAESGADYAKFQTWKVDRLIPGPWDTDGRREIYEKAELSKDDHFLLKEKCDDLGIKFLTSCFCPEDVPFVQSLCDEVKIPGCESYNIELAKAVVGNFDRIFVSTGSAKSDEYYPWTRFENIVLMHCVSSYPCPPDRINLPKLHRMLDFPCEIGYSGHSPGIWDAVAAIAHGATVVEKHFTIDHDLPGRDNKYALLPHEFERIVNFAAEFPDMMLDHGPDFQECEQDTRDQYAKRWG